MTEQEPAEGAAAAKLVTTVRRLQIWVIVLTVLVALLIAAVIVGFVRWPRDTDDDQVPANSTPVMTVTDQQLATARQEIQSAYGDTLDSLDVCRVTMDYNDPSLPAGAGGEEQFIYVNYRLKGSSVVVADIVGGPFGPDAASMGMLPTQGSLTSRMTQEKFDRLLLAYAAETSAPLSNVRRYNDSIAMMVPGAPQNGVVPVGDKKYKASDLWAASEGLLVEGDRLGMETLGASRKALIFYEDPRSGAFTFLGTEPAVGGW